MDSNEKSYFKEAMKGVKPLRQSKKISPQKQSSTTPRTRFENQAPQSPIQAQNKLSRPWDNTSDILPETCLSFGKTRIQAKQFKALKQGLIRPESRLDLHGFHLEKAGDALLRFIHEAQAVNLRCVLIVHGKGGRFHEPPRLKIHVDHWLKQLPEVLAFHSAKARDGGHGAVYVLLKNT